MAKGSDAPFSHLHEGPLLCLRACSWGSGARTGAGRCQPFWAQGIAALTMWVHKVGVHQPPQSPPEIDTQPGRGKGRWRSLAGPPRPSLNDLSRDSLLVQVAGLKDRDGPSWAWAVDMG